MASRHNLRVAFMAMLPVSNAATRAFCTRPCGRLVRRGFDAWTSLPSSPAVYSFTQQRRRLRPLLVALYWYAIVAPRRVWQVLRALRADAIVIQRSLFRYTSPPVLEAFLWLVGAKLLRRAIFYQCDDALHLIRPRHYALRFRMCHRVLTGNRQIAAFAESVGARVTLVDGPVEVERYPGPGRPQRDHVVIGWVGLVPLLDIAPIVPALARVCLLRPQVRIDIVSDERATFPGLEDALEWRRWRLEDEFSLFETFDIGVMPLPDTEYNRGREAYKIKEYMAAGLPVVCSPTGHNIYVVEEGVTGFFAGTEDEWVDRLLHLVDDPRLRLAIGAAARRRAAKHYNGDHYVNQLLDVVRTETRRARVDCVRRKRAVGVVRDTLMRRQQDAKETRSP